MINTVQDMFRNYQDIPDSYIPSNTTKSLCMDRVPENPIAVYDANGVIIGYSWYYGDNIVLEFKTTGEVTEDSNLTTESLDYYLRGKKFELSFINFRYETVYTMTIDADEIVKFYIEGDIYKNLCRGVYTLKLNLLDESKQIVTTLFGTNNGLIYII